MVHSNSKNINSSEIIYVSHPEHYTIKYKINQWMNLDTKIDSSKAIYQWNQYVKVLNNAGASVHHLPAGIWPDTVFIADAGIIIDNYFILSNFRHPERQLEQEHWLAVAESLGYIAVKLPSEIILEGTGDCLIGNQYAFLGVGNRSNGLRNEVLAHYLQRDIIPLHLDNKDFFHLDTCMAYVSDSLVIMHPDAISSESRKDVEKRVCVLYIDDNEIYNFAANIVRINNNIVIQRGNPKIIKKLSKLGFNIIEVDTSEFMKGGGSCKCLSLRKYSSLQR